MAQNLLLQSSTFNVSPWSVNNLTTSANQYANPIDGAVTAFSLVGAADAGSVTHYLQQSFTTVIGRKVTFSVHAKADTLSQLFLYGDLLGAVVNIGFDLTTGLAISSVGSVTGTCSAIVGAAGWYRCSITFSPIVTTGMVRVYLGKLGSATYQGSVADKVTIFASQLIQSNWAGDYVATTTVAVGTTTPPPNMVNMLGQNLLLQSENLSTSWAVTKASVATNQIANPITGAMTVDVLSDTSDGLSSFLHYINPTVAPVLLTGVVYTFSALVKANGGQWLELGTNAANTIVWFDLLNGVIGTQSSDVLKANIMAVPGNAGWYWCILTFKQITGNVYFITGNAVNSNSYAGTASIKFFITDTQLVQGNWQGERTPTTTAAIGATTPPTNIISKNEQNLLRQSETFATTWTPSTCTITSNTLDTLDPLGGNNADIIVETDSASATHFIYLSPTVSTVIGRVYTYSVWVKSGVNSWFYLECDSATTAVYFNTTTGAASSTNRLGTQIAADSTSYGNGWFRIWLTYKATTTAGTAYLVASTALGTVAWVGVAGVKDTYIWGAQLVQGNNPGEYVPTTTLALGTTIPPINIAQVTNLCLWSEDQSNAAWTKGVGVVATVNTLDVLDPIGGNAATKLAYDGSAGAGTYKLVNNTLNPARMKGDIGSTGIWARVASGTRSVIFQDNYGAVNGNYILTTSWQFLQLTSAPSTLTSNTLLVSIYDAAGVNGAHTLYTWGGQANYGPRLSPYVKTTSAKIGSSESSVPGMSPAAQNLVLQSSHVEVGGTWVISGASPDLTVLANQLANPITGLTTAALITDRTGTNTYHAMIQSFSQSLPQGIYTYTVILKAGPTIRWIDLGFQVTGTNVYFDILNGVTGSKTALCLASRIEAIPGWAGWYRCSATVYMNLVNVQIYPASADGTVTYGSTALGYSFYFADAKLEAGYGSVDWAETTTLAVNPGATQRAI